MIIIEDFIADDEEEEEVLRIPPLNVVESRRRTLLGYIMHTRMDYFLPRWVAQQPITSFFCTSEEGEQLVQGNWGFFDPTLAFLGCPVDVLASSNGFLLCRANPKEHLYGSSSNEPPNTDYIVCNPVTRQFLRLPKPKTPYLHAPVAFICRGDCVTSLDEIEFEVVQASAPKALEVVSSALIETFSSRTYTWHETLVTSDLPFDLRCHVHFGPVVIGGVIFWSTYDHALLAYDPRQEGVGAAARLIQPPPGSEGQKFLCETDLHGISEGKLHYARSGHQCLELWVLEDGQGDGGYGWVIKHRASTAPPMLTIEAFHPQNSDTILITSCMVLHWYDLRSKQKRIIFGLAPSRTTFLPYEWPAPSNLSFSSLRN